MSDPSIAFRRVQPVRDVVSFPDYQDAGPSLEHVEEAARIVLEGCAGLRSDEHGENTPMRFIEMLQELTACAPTGDEHRDSLHNKGCIKWKDFASAGMQDMITIRKIPFSSLCNHHVVPFTGFAHIAYVPQDKMAGLSKFARVVQHFARQLQVQERLTAQIADYLEAMLSPKGVGVIMSAEHMCMTIRGVQAPGTFTTTSVMRGVFSKHDRTAKAEFLSMVNSHGQ